ncbi:MAG: hypothetical protein LUC88_06345 [Prevotella sp.]|nr:hypothetical protein [Prevotella sp.]
MKVSIIHKAILLLGISLLVLGCGRTTSKNMEEKTVTLSEEQDALIDAGWYVRSTMPSGELPEEYGVENRYGQQDKYFDIEMGNGCDVAIKIMDAATDKCIRYVIVPEGTVINTQMILQGKYYLKLAYGKDWMEYNNGDGTLKAKFTRNVAYGRSVDAFDFGKKNTSQFVDYKLQINVVNSEVQNNFNTVSISEEEFME